MKVFRELRVKLTDAEWSVAAIQMAAEQQKIQEIEAEKAEINTTFKARLQGHAQKLSELGLKVRSREEARSVECQERYDLQRLTAELYRLDTGELVESRPMSAHERQEALQEVLPGVSREPPESQPEE